MGADANSWCRLGFGEPRAVYTSATQQARHLTEGWMAGHGFCPACPADRLPPLPNNTRVGDFRCADCGEEYELKAGQGAIAGVLPAGAWNAMQQRLAAANNPSLFVMGYDRAAHRVSDLIVVLRHFFTGAIVRPRPPLGPNARRAAWAVTLFLRDERPEARGWLLAVMQAVEAVTAAAGRPDFTLAELYARAPDLAARFPANRHVREKMRQQLQVLRDRGWLSFEGRGRYRLH